MADRREQWKEAATEARRGGRRSLAWRTQQVVQIERKYSPPAMLQQGQITGVSGANKTMSWRLRLFSSRFGFFARASASRENPVGRESALAITYLLRSFNCLLLRAIIG